MSTNSKYYTMWSFIVLALVQRRATAQIPSASCLPGTYDWLNNSLGQDPCQVATDLCHACRPIRHPSDCQLDQFSDEGDYYQNVERPVSCDCSTIEWMLLGACGACQGGATAVLPWSNWSSNCTDGVWFSELPVDVPATTRIPAWAYLNTTNGNYFHLSDISDFLNQPGDHPDSSASMPLATTSIAGSPSETATSPADDAKGNIVPPIVGGVVGGVGGLLIIFSGLLYWFKHRHSSLQTQASDPHMKAAKMTYMSSRLFLGSTKKLYDPNDPTTYPALEPGSVTPASQNFDDTETTQPPLVTKDRYNGLPEVA
ncbi:hypothetical protein BC629DRAFT_961577 [Irpex lacteus]|nr:hypothetical protein BC629DRAFT_961577 [Irpex lacteus]